jgi:hypothetical protein
MVLRFSNKRGRPKKNKEKFDLGTKELRRKKKFFLFESFLLFLRNSELICEEEYQLSMWFRYLYSIKFGNPNVITAYNLVKVKGVNSFAINKIKQKKMEFLYNQISKKLEKKGVKNLMMDVCIFDVKIKNFNLENFKSGLGIIGSFYKR